MNPNPDFGRSGPRYIGGWEFGILSCIIVVSFAMRFGLPERLGVEHFDEGVYASNVWFGNSKEASYPEQHLYAPPLVPLLIELTFLFTGPSNQGAMFPGQLAGALTPLALWWLGRRWFGVVAGCVAASFCALSDIHIMLSRSALTDVPLGFWWVLAMLGLREACTQGRFFSSLFAGCCVGLAWWTKYNGWMPLGIALGAIVLRGLVMFQRHDSLAWPATRTAIRGWLMASTTAVLIWLPWIWSLQTRGGYIGVLTNHRRYIVGLAGWWSSFERQAAQLSSLSGLWTTISCALIFLILPLVAARRGPHLNSTNVTSEDAKSPGCFSKQPFEDFVRWGFNVVQCIWSVPALVGNAIVGLSLRGLRDHDAIGRSIDSQRADLSGWMLMVWFVGLFASTPMYHPYARITIPFLLSCFLAVGVLIQVTHRRRRGDHKFFSPDQVLPSLHLMGRFQPFLTLAFLLIILYPTWTRVNRALAPQIPFPVRTDLRRAANQMVTLIESAAASTSSNSENSVVYVFAEPALLFQLRLAGLQNVGPAGSLSFAQSRVPSASRVYLAIGIHAKRDPDFVDPFNRMRHRFKPVGSWPWHLSPLVSLDQDYVSPGRLGDDPGKTTSVELFELIGE